MTSGWAVLNGAAYPNGVSATAYFQYGNTTAYGSMGRTRTATLLKFSGSFDFCYDNGATNQGLVRTALSAGSDLWIEILPDGTHGAKCCCKIESIDYKAPVDGVVKCSAKFVENGAWATV